MKETPNPKVSISKKTTNKRGKQKKETTIRHIGPSSDPLPPARNAGKGDNGVAARYIWFLRSLKI